MKRLALLFLFVIAGAGLAQEGMDMTPPKEMAQAGFFLGTWTGPMTIYEPSGQATKSKGKIVATKTMNGRYVHSDHSFTQGPMTFSGLQLLTYDPAEKAWKAWWFDSVGPGAMEMTGNWMGKTLRLVSKPTPVPGMGDQTFRSSYTKAGAKKLEFLLEIKAPDGSWQKMIVASFTKK